MSAKGSAAVDLDVYGLSIRIEGDWDEVVTEIGRDYAWFRRHDEGARPPSVRVRVRRQEPDFDSLGELSSSFVTPRNVVYQDGDRSIVDYFGKAIAVLDRRSGEVEISGEEAPLVHEAGYLFLLSRIGEHVDALGFVRLHSLGVAGSDGAVAVMLPSGGGKSTLGLSALQDHGVRLISEDSPLLDRRGSLHPFPLRIGINETDRERLGDVEVRRIERMEFHPKLAVDVDAFSDRIATEPTPLRHLVLGHRTLGRDAALDRLPRRAAFGPLFREAVVGLGIYQGMEFVLQRGLRDVTGMAGIAARRSLSSGAALRGAQVWRLSLGRDLERNWQVLRPLLGD